MNSSTNDMNNSGVVGTPTDRPRGEAPSNNNRTISNIHDHTYNLRPFCELYFTRDDTEDNTIYRRIVTSLKPTDIDVFKSRYDFWVGLLRDLFCESQPQSVWVERNFLQALLSQTALQPRANLMVHFFSDQHVEYLLRERYLGTAFIFTFAMYGFHSFHFDETNLRAVKQVSELIAAGFEVRGLAGCLTTLFLRQSMSWVELPKSKDVQIINPVCEVVYTGKDLLYGIRRSHRQWFSQTITHQAFWNTKAQDDTSESESSMSMNDFRPPGKRNATTRLGSDFTRGSLETIIDYFVPGVLNSIDGFQSKLDKANGCFDKIGDILNHPTSLSILILCELIECVLAVYKVKLPILQSTRTVRTIMLTIAGFAHVANFENQAHGDVTWTRVFSRFCGIFTGLGKNIVDGLCDLCEKCFDAYTGLEDYTAPDFWFNLLGKIPDLFKGIVAFITEKFPNIAVTMPGFCFSDKVVKYCKLAEDLLENKSINLDIYTKMLTTYGFIGKMIGSRDTKLSDRAALTYWYRRLEEVLEVNKAYGVLNNCSRHKPPAVVFMGGPGEGKGFSQARLVEFLTYHLVGEVNLENGANPYVFNYCSASKHFDGYNPTSNKITVIDDFMQQKDSEGVDNSEAVMFSRIVNEAPFVPPMADVSAKGKLFKTEIVVASTNVRCFDHNTLPSVTDPGAITRRIDFYVKVIPNKDHPDYLGLNKPVKDVSQLFKETEKIDLDRLRYLVWDRQYEVGASNNSHFPRDKAVVVDFYGLLDMVKTRYHENIAKADRISTMVAEMLNRATPDSECSISEELALFEPDLFSKYFAQVKTTLGSISFDDYIASWREKVSSGIDKLLLFFFSSCNQICKLLKEPLLLVGLGFGIISSLPKKTTEARVVVHHYTDTDVEMVEPLHDFELQARTQVVRDISAKIIKSNTYAVFAGDRRLGWGVFVMEDILLMPKHFLDIAMNNGLNYIRIQHNLSRDKVLNINLTRLQFKQVGEQDLVLVRVCGVRSHADITCYMQSDLVSCDSSRDICVSIPENNGALSHYITTGKMFTPGQLQAAGSELVHQPIVYSCKTVGGDCGSLVFIDETHTKANFVLAGMHTAGTSHLGVGEQISRKSILANLPYVPKSRMSILEVDLVPMEKQSGGEPYLFRAPRPVFLPDSTSFLKSSFHKYVPDFDIHQPAILRPCVVNGKEFVPTQKYIDTLARTFFNDDLETIKLVATSVVADVFSYSKTSLPLGRLTFEQAVTGEGTDGYIGSLNRSTSAGYPECFIASKTGLKGKQHLFGTTGDFDFSSEHCIRLRKEVDIMLDYYARGERKLVFGMYFPKDELLKSEKRERTTRAIVGISVALVVAQRMIWGRVFEDIVRHGVRNGICIGINPFSSDWDFLYSELSGFSDYLGDGDFKDFSATQDKAIITALLEALALKCFDGDLLDLALGSIPDIASGYVVIRGKIVQICSPGDGSFLTTILNCLMVKTILCLAWVDAFGLHELPAFFQNVMIKAYGDDHLTAVKAKYKDSFSGDVIRTRAAKRGFTYTPGNKGTDFEYKHYTKLEFLKRLPRFEPLVGHIVGALQLTSIFKSLHWDRKKDIEYKAGKFRTALLELSLHEPCVWDRYIEPIKAYIREVTPNFQVFDRKYYVEMTRKFPGAKLYNPVLAGSDSEIPLQWQSGSLLVGKTSDAFFNLNREIDMATTTGKIEDISLKREQDTTVTRVATTVNAVAGATEMAQDRMVESLSSNFKDTGKVVTDIEDLKSFFVRPIKISSGTITTSNAALSVVGGPLKLFANYITLPIVKNKLQGYLGFRGCTKLHLKLNATRFQQGLLRLVYYPGDANQARCKFGMRLTSLVPFSQLPGITIDISKDSEVEFCIPYVRPELYYNLVNGDGEVATVFLVVYSPLVVGSGEVSAFDWTLYMSLEDVEFAMPALTLQASEQELMNVKPISSAIGDISTAATRLGTIPVLSSVAKPVAWFTAALSKAVSAFGFSKPILDQNLHVVQGKTAVFNPNSDGVDGSISLGLSALNSIGLLPEAFGHVEDEMSAEYICRRFGFHSQVTFVDQPVGTVLRSINWYASDMTSAFGDSGCSVKWNLPFEYLASMFEYFTGDLVLRITAVKTEFHSGRLLVSFTPQSTTAPTIAQSDYLLKTIVDLRDDSIFEIRVPFPSLLPYLKTSDLAGAIHVIVLNELRAPASVAQNINLIFELCMENVEFACPDSTFRGCLPYTTGAFVGQARLDLAPGSKRTLNSDSPLHCQGELVRSLHTVTKAHYTAGCLDLSPPEENYPLIEPLGAGSAVTGPINFFNLGSFSSIISALTQGPVLSPTPIDGLAWMYAFHRGSYRAKIQPATTTFPVSTYVVKANSNLTDQISNYGAADGVVAFAQRNAIGDTYSNMVEVRVPHFHQTFLKRNVYVNAGQASTPTAEEDCNQQLLAVRHADNVSPLPKYWLLRSVGDDFQFGFFLSAPCTFISKP